MTMPLPAFAMSSALRHAKLGWLALAALIASVGGWAALADISGAVIAHGTVVVEANVKTVQHPTGGVVAEIRVREGELVDAGQVLIRLDATQLRATYTIASIALDELTARKARLESERDAISEIAFPPDLLARAGEPGVRARMESEQRALEVRSRSSEGRKAQLRERISQLNNSIEGYEVRRKAKIKELEFIARELSGARDLWRKGLIPISKLTALEREETRLEGERGQLISLSAEIKAKISETELQILQVDHDLHNDIVRELREADAKIGELRERVTAADDQLRRVDIRAPHAGRVLQLSVHNLAAVVGAGDPLMLIVPEDDLLGIDVRVNPPDIDQLHLGQQARLRILAFNHSTTPEIHGTVTRIPADSQLDQRSGSSFYNVRISVDEPRNALGELKLIPGMPVEAFIKTFDRTAISYLLKPITDQLQRAFKDS